MKNLVKIGFLIALMLACAQLGVPQEQSRRLPANPKFKHYRIITQAYDPSSDQTNIYLEDINVYSAPGPVYGVDMGALFTFPGKTMIAPQQISLWLSILTSDVANKYQARVQADDEVLLEDSYPITSMHDYGRDDRERVTLYLAELELVISYEKFQQLVNAHKVKIKIGENEGELSEDEMESLRDFASRIQL